MNNLCICGICDTAFKSLTTLTIHFKKIHNYSSTEYYNRFIKPGVDDNCPFCERKKKFLNLNVGYSQTCCSKACKRRNCSRLSSSTEVKERKKQAYLIKYGVDNPSKSNEVKEKRKLTCIEHYGVDNPLKVNEIREKTKQTKLERYGDENFVNVAKTKQTKLDRYGDENFVNVDRIKQTKLKHYSDENYNNRQKMKQTKFERYEDENFVNVEKSKQTKLERYGDENYTNREKSKQSCLEKYGVEYYTQTHEFHSKKRHRIRYKDMSFDSKDELKLYKYCESSGIPVKYNPCKIEYEDEFGGKHYYMPDFEINGKLYEVKGDHLWKDGHLYFPYRNDMSNDDLIKIDAVYRAKDKCMKENGVALILSSKLNAFIENESFNI